MSFFLLLTYLIFVNLGVLLYHPSYDVATLFIVISLLSCSVSL